MAATHLPPSADVIRQALAYVSPAARDDRVTIAMAVKDALGPEGFDVWDEWARQGEKYTPQDARDCWKSIKPGKITVGTLLGRAKDAGFDVVKARGGERSEPTAAQVEAEHARRDAARAAEAARYRERADKAAHEARQLWDQAKPGGRSPYLDRKGVQAYGVRVLTDGTLLVPMRDATGELMNLQRIAAAKPAEGPEKRYMPGGRKSGLWHWCGEPGHDPAVVLLAEGYATGASLHAATGDPVAVAFDAGNLVHVAKALRQLHPEAVFLVCGDDDRGTETKTGKNPGREKAEAAARAADAPGYPARAVFPGDRLPEGGTDFNDLEQHVGPSAVRSIVGPMVEALRRNEVAPLRRRQAQRSTDAAGAPPGRRHPPADEGHHAEASMPGGGRDPFQADESGVWFIGKDKDGQDRRPVWLCAPLLVSAMSRAEDANGWGYLLQFQDQDDNPKSWAMPASMLSGDGSEWAGRLRDMGLRIAYGNTHRNLLGQFIETRQPDARVTCTDRVGWHGSTYVLPSSSINASGELRYVFQSEAGLEDTFRQHGELADWRDRVAGLAAGNSRFVFALCCAFAGPTLRPAGIESGGFHFRGMSSKGKTTALRLASSVWGRPTFMQRWRTTDNALEATAVQHCDCTLVLDEFAQLDPKVAGECAYMLANEQEKGRSTRGGFNRRRRTWRLLFLSSGEISLADHIAEAGRRVRAGMEVRMVDIPLEAGAGMGAVQDLHGHGTPAEFVEAMTAAAAKLYGSAGRVWLQHLCHVHDRLPAELHGLVEEYRSMLVPGDAGEQVGRVATRFAVVAAAGELATRAGITGWPAGHAIWASGECFDAWLAARGHVHNSEGVAMVRQVRAWIEKNGDALLTWLHRSLDDHRPNTALRAGFKRLVDPSGKPLRQDAATDWLDRHSRSGTAERDDALIEYLVLPEAFRNDVCRGLDAAAVARELRDLGLLVHEADRFTMKQRIPGIGKVPVYHLKASILA